MRDQHPANRGVDFDPDKKWNQLDWAYALYHFSTEGWSVGQDIASVLALSTIILRTNQKRHAPNRLTALRFGQWTLPILVRCILSGEDRLQVLPS